MQNLLKYFEFFLLLLITPLTASADSQNENPASPYFSKVGDTVFVSGHFNFWMNELYELLPHSHSDIHHKDFYNNPDRKFNTIVFVNERSPGFENPMAASRMNGWFKRLEITTVIAGRCDLFCSRMFAGGKNRLFAQDIGSEKSRFSIQVPIDFETKNIDPRFPNTQVAVFEYTLPKFSEIYRDMLIQGFTKPIDATGGLNIYPMQPPKYCDSFQNENSCKEYPGLDAFKMGLTTSAEVVFITLPKGFPAPTDTGFAKINDEKSIPLKSEASRTAYLDFLKKYPSGRVFAISENIEESSWGWASGGKNPVGRALNSCQKKTKSPCRLYAVDHDVVW